jgi:hypothetical protein
MATATDCGFDILPHPQYSPALAPSEFCLFPKLKTKLSGRRFGSNEGVMEAVHEFFEDQNRVVQFLMYRFNQTESAILMLFCCD